MIVLIPVTSHQLSRIVTFYGPDQWRRPPCVFGLRWPGALDESTVRAALSLLPWRHTALRSYFPASALAGYACLTPEPAGDFPVTTLDLTTPAGDGTRNPERERMRLLCAPFDMAEPPLYRAVVFRHADHTTLGIAVDHAIFDGVSARLFAEEFVSLYEALEAGTDPAGLTTQVSDFAVFASAERDWPRSAEGRAAVEYWLPRWHAFGPFPDPGLPNKIATAESPGTGSTWQRSIPGRPFATVAERARSLRVTPFIIVSAAMFAALRECTGADRHGLVVPYARRYGLPGEGLGNYSNRVLLTVGEPTATRDEFVERVADSVWGMLQHGMMPFEDLIRLTTDGAFTRPVTPYLHVNFVTRPGPFHVGGTTAEFTWLEDEETYARMSSALFVTLEVTPSGGADLTCGYGGAYYAADVVDEFMSAVERHLMPDR